MKCCPLLAGTLRAGIGQKELDEKSEPHGGTWARNCGINLILGKAHSTGKEERETEQGMPN